MAWGCQAEQEPHPAKNLRFVAKQQRLADNVYTCYDAGALGYQLHRRLTEMGVIDYVVPPQDWDERGKGVKDDRLDALALCQRLDRFIRGRTARPKTGEGSCLPSRASCACRLRRKNAIEPSPASANKLCGGRPAGCGPSPGALALRDRPFKRFRAERSRSIPSGP